MYSSGNKAEEFTGSVGFLQWDRCVLGLIAFSCHSVFSLSDTSSSSESSPRADSVNREMCWHAAQPAGRSLQRKKNVSMHTHMRGRTMERTRGVQILVGILIPDWLLMWCKAT